jgi:hypothetical protein
VATDLLRRGEFTGSGGTEVTDRSALISLTLHLSSLLSPSLSLSPRAEDPAAAWRCML